MNNKIISKILIKILPLIFLSTIITNIFMYLFDFFKSGGLERYFSGSFDFSGNIFLEILKCFFYFKINIFFFLINLLTIFLSTLVFIFHKLLDTRNFNSVVNKNQYGDSRFATLKEIKNQYKEIPEKDIEYEGQGGILISRYKDKVYVDNDPVQTLLIGITRSYKDESVIIPSIDILSRSKEKPSIIINDPKGDTYSASCEILEKRGYDVEVINILSPEKSANFNPLQLVIDEWKNGKTTESVSLLENISYILFKNEIEKSNDPFWTEASISLFNSVALNMIDECIKKGEEWKVSIYTILKFVSEMMTEEVRAMDNEDDVSYDEDSLGLKLDEYFNKYPIDYQPRLLYSTFGDAKGKTRAGVLAVFKSKLRLFFNQDVALMTCKNTINLESVGFKNKGNIFKLKIKNTVFNELLGLDEIILKNKDNINLSTEVLEKYIKLFRKTKENIKQEEIEFLNFLNHNFILAENELKIILKLESFEKIVFEKVYLKNSIEYVRIFNYLLEKYEVKRTVNIENKIKDNSLLIKEINYHLQNDYLLEEIKANDIENEVEIVESKPKAIFLIIPDYDKSKNFLATIFIEQLYFALSKRAVFSKNKCCDREVYFLINELKQLPVIKNLDSMITMSLSRRIKFLLVIQSFTQLKDDYKTAGQTIIENCANKIYMLSDDDDTCEKISKGCGTKTVLSFSQSGRHSDITKSETVSAKEERVILAQDVKKLNVNENIVLRTIKRVDLKGRKIKAHAIYNRAENGTELKPRYEYLKDTFNPYIELQELLDRKYKDNIYDLTKYRFEMEDR